MFYMIFCTFILKISQPIYQTVIYKSPILHKMRLTIIKNGLLMECKVLSSMAQALLMILFINYFPNVERGYGFVSYTLSVFPRLSIRCWRVRAKNGTVLTFCLKRVDEDSFN